MGQHIVVCPYMAIFGIGCSHRFAERLKDGGRRKSVCRYKNNPEECPLFRNWEEDISTKLKVDNKFTETFLKKASKILK